MRKRRKRKNREGGCKKERVNKRNFKISWKSTTSVRKTDKKRDRKWDKLWTKDKRVNRQYDN